MAVEISEKFLQELVKPSEDAPMTSSVISITSSLTSPVDSGVQLLDSESDVTSLMSISGLGFDAETAHFDNKLQPAESLVMTKSDIDNHNDVTVQAIKTNDDLMTISLTSYELLDYTQQNANEMHVSMSEEVSECLKVDQADEQIVFRRHRKKKTETPKKRVSFHEDILNNTRIDDIHINHGFITHEPDISMSFFSKGFVRKPDVVKGRYSWAAEGDSPYYQKNEAEREVQSDIYVHNARFSSTSSSSSNSISSSVDDDDIVKKEPSQKAVPKTSCLKKNKRLKKYIDTNIVEEERKPPESNLLDTNIFGSLKNMFSFASTIPLTERGVPEGQEDVQKHGDLITKPVNMKNNLKLTISEGFYPNYPNNQALPANIIVCASNVYEHKGISYSYEYENFKKTFENQSKPKSSTLYQTLLNELNFFKRKEKKAIENEAKEPLNASLCSLKLQEIQNDLASIRKSTSTATIDFSDSDSTFDYVNDSGNTRHLSSPKRKNKKRNSCNLDEAEMLTVKALPNSRPTSKTSLINRFLRNVTVKKVLDLKMQKKCERKNYIGLYVKGIRNGVFANKVVDKEIEMEIVNGRTRNKSSMEDFNIHLLYRFKHEIFRNFSENLIMVFPVNSAYTTSGESKTLMVVLTNSTIYITGYRHNNSYCNHFVLPYTELNTILIGPNAQTIHFANYDNDMQCIITTGSENLTNELMGQLEMAIRRDINRPKLPAVKQLTMRDMINLRRVICKQTPIEKDAEYFHYSIISLLDHSDDNETPLGPTKEGPLMFKTTDGNGRWETAYFILKAGILYMLSSPTHRLPMRVLPLINGACQGAQRVYNSSRPHTFQVQVNGITLYLAAPNEYVASEWLQTLVQAASKTYLHRERTTVQSCSLLMTNDHIVIVREAFPCVFSSTLSLREQHQPIKGTRILSCAAIADIVAFRLPCAEQSWCVLEFACREVLESSGDWIIYFATNNELEKFISMLEILWGYHNEQEDCFPISTIPETDVLSKKCIDTYNILQNTWLSLQINLQTF